ncbi:hypothetical protein MMC09_001290 [Bachmanniomyces sp. S44760]|nr:hypothetical protein [Bachmanniomyces sp. S44760]
MDAPSFYAFSSAIWLTLQAIPLLLSPSLIITFLAEEARKPTALEIYLSRTQALSLLALAILPILLTGSVPLGPISSSFSDSDSTQQVSPYTVPTILVTTFYHAVTAFYAYANYTTTNINGAVGSSPSPAFVFSIVGNGGLAMFGGWCCLFAGGGHVSRRTGKDKRTSAFPFGERKGKGKGKGEKGL